MVVIIPIIGSSGDYAKGLALFAAIILCTYLYISALSDYRQPYYEGCMTARSQVYTAIYEQPKNVFSCGIKAYVPNVPHIEVSRNSGISVSLFDHEYDATKK